MAVPRDPDSATECARAGHSADGVQFAPLGRVRETIRSRTMARLGSIGLRVQFGVGMAALLSAHCGARSPLDDEYPSYQDNSQTTTPADAAPPSPTALDARPT